MPIEYCEYSADKEACKRWLEQNLPDLYKQVHCIADGEGATACAASGTVADSGDADADDKKKTKRGGKGATKKKSAKAPGALDAHVTIKTEQRGKNKSVTIIKGLATGGQLSFCPETRSS